MSIFLPTGSMDARYEHLDTPDANTRVLNGTTEQLLCDETNKMHTMKVSMVNGVATLVCDQEGMTR